MDDRFIAPVTLRGTHASLEPLVAAHLDAIKAAAADGALWRLWYTSVPPPEKTKDWIESALGAREASGGPKIPSARDRGELALVGGRRER